MMCFLAMIALRRHISRIHQIIYEGKRNSSCEPLHTRLDDGVYSDLARSASADPGQPHPGLSTDILYYSHPILPIFMQYVAD